jgi:hypothetical protein
MPDREQEGLMKARTSYLKLLSASTMGLLVIMVAGYLMSERASAQPGPPTNPVLAAIQELQQTIVTLQNSVNALQASVDALGAPSQVNFRWTPAANVGNSRLECIVVNISDVQKTIHVELKNRDGSNETEATVDLAPGAASSAVNKISSGELHCKFTVISGTRADIRGLFMGLDANGRAFVIPAE